MLDLPIPIYSICYLNLLLSKIYALLKIYSRYKNEGYIKEYSYKII